MGDTSGSVDEPDAERAESPEPVDRDVYWDDGLPGQPLSSLLFVCARHGEQMAVEYYDPEAPPRCSKGDLMVRKAQ